MDDQLPPKTEVIETVKSETTIKGDKPAQTESTVGGVSVRGWIAVMLLTTVCVMSFMNKEVGEPLRSSALLALGFYFGQRSTKNLT